MVHDSKNQPVFVQIISVFDWAKQHRGIYTPRLGSIKRYRVIFKANVPSLGTYYFKVKIFGSNNGAYNKSHTQISELVVYSNSRYFDLHKTQNLFQTKFVESRSFNVVSHDLNEYHFAENGLLSHVVLKDGTQFQISLKFLKYLTHGPFQDKSGAYLFRPRGKAAPLYDRRNIVIVSEGMYESRVSAGFEFGVHEMLFKDSEVEVQNWIDIGKRDDTEIVMRVCTDIQSGNQFYTDLNGFQLVKREILSKIPLQANYYPIPSTIYIQDHQHRFTIVTGQPLGGSSLRSGQIEIMQDRRLTESDGRGLGEGVLDNRPIRNLFKFVLEGQSQVRSRVHERHPSGFHSKRSHNEGQRLLFPLIRAVDLNYEIPDIPTEISLEAASGLEIVLLKQLNERDIGLVLHKTYLEGETENSVLKLDLKDLLRLKSGQIHASTVMLLSVQGPEMTTFKISLKQMETKAFIIKNAAFMS